MMVITLDAYLFEYILDTNSKQALPSLVDFTPNISSYSH